MNWSEFFFFIVAAVLIVGLALPRRQLHLIGLVGMTLMTYRAITHGPDWPMALLNGSSIFVHAYMLLRLWLSGRKAL